MKIGSFELANPVIAAPMAGVSDKPYRQQCRQHGAGLVVSEMLTAKPELRHSTKFRYRADLSGEPGPIVVQLVGTEPALLAEAAKHNVGNGAQIIDINMGCPAKKVCKKAAGSALLENEALVEQILDAVVSAVSVPVTLKIRTGANPLQKNAVTIAKIAEQCGVQSLTVHGRTRQCKFVGAVEYDTIASIKAAISIPVVANGDIDSAKKAQQVLNYTQADAVMIGRAAQGQPWLFGQVAQYLATGELIDPPSIEERSRSILSHLSDIHQFYRPDLAVRLARKHIKWYLHHWDFPINDELRAQINQTEESNIQFELMRGFLTLQDQAVAAQAA